MDGFIKRSTDCQEKNHILAEHLAETFQTELKNWFEKLPIKINSNIYNAIFSKPCDVKM